VFEVVNKDFDWRAGKVRLQIVDTNYSTGVRYGTWAPASEIVEKVGTNQLRVQNSFGSDSESDKWLPYTNRTLRLRAPDYSASELVKFVQFDPADPFLVTVSPAITAPDLTGWIMDVPPYDSLNASNDSLYKAVHVFWNPTVPIVASSAFSNYFEVAPGDVAKFWVGAPLRIRNADYSKDTKGKLLRVASVAGNVVTMNDFANIVPDTDCVVDLIGFESDNGAPYVWV